MKRLERLKLYGDGLVHISSPVLVARYNETLEELGLPQTELSEFNIDGMGWSPEIAEERGERYYLSHGMANPLAIILTPEQEKKPIYAPYASYNRRLMEVYFNRFLSQIVDITRSTALWLELDQQLSRFNSPRDLLLVPYVVVRSHAGQLIDAAGRQKALVLRYQAGELGWFDDDLRSLIVASAKAYGDLRFRRLSISDLRFDDVRSFYTGLFGGTFVFRDLLADDDLLLLGHASPSRQLEDVEDDIHYLDNTYLFQRLAIEELVTLDLDWYRSRPDVLRSKLEYLAVDLLCQEDPEMDFSELTVPQRKQKIRALDKDISEPYFEFERLIVQLQSQEVKPKDLSPQIHNMLVHPHPRLETGSSVHDLVWQLVSRLSPLDVLRLYISDKEAFFEAYQSWPESKKRWAADHIASRYRPKMGG